MNHRGVSLLELLIAIVFIVTGLTMIGLFSARATRLSLDSRKRWQASEIARTQLEQLKNQPYSALIPTAAASPPFITGGLAVNGGCNCGDALTDFTDPAHLLVPTSVIASSITYTTQTCINYADLTGANSTLQSHCAPAGDPGTLYDTNTKAIRVRVSWTVSGSTQTDFTETEGLVSR